MDEDRTELVSGTRVLCWVYVLNSSCHIHSSVNKFFIIMLFVSVLVFPLKRIAIEVHDGVAQEKFV